MARAERENRNRGETEEKDVPEKEKRRVRPGDRGEESQPVVAVEG